MLQEYAAALAGIDTLQWSGRVRELAGLVVTSDGPAAGIGGPELTTGNRIGYRFH